MDDNVQIMKRRRMNSNNEDGCPNNQLRLIDINADCLRKIFKPLSLDQLIDLVDANLTDCEEDENVFNIQTDVRTHPYQASIRDAFLENVRTTDIDAFSNDPDYFWYDEKTLRYFGSLIADISLSYYSEFYRHNAQIEEALLKYCTTTLSKISINNSDQCAFENIDEPFTNVTEITITNGYLSKELSDFNK